MILKSCEIFTYVGMLKICMVINMLLRKIFQNKMKNKLKKKRQNGKRARKKAFPAPKASRLYSISFRSFVRRNSIAGARWYSFRVKDFLKSSQLVKVAKKLRFEQIMQMFDLNSNRPSRQRA